MLMKLLQKYESLFDGTLGEWNLPPVDLELKEGTEPFCSRAFPVPKIHEETLRKEIARLIEIGVLIEDSDSEVVVQIVIFLKDNTLILPGNMFGNNSVGAQVTMPWSVVM